MHFVNSIIVIICFQLLVYLALYRIESVKIIKSTLRENNKKYVTGANLAKL